MRYWLSFKLCHGLWQFNLRLEIINFYCYKVLDIKINKEQRLKCNSSHIAPCNGGQIRRLNVVTVVLFLTVSFFVPFFFHLFFLQF